MWTEITIEQARQFATTGQEPALERLCSRQREMTEYYAKQSTPGNVANILLSSETLKPRAFEYQDENTDMHLVLRLDAEGKLRVLTAAIGSHKNIVESAKILLAKLYEAMGEYEVDYCYSLIPTDRKTKGQVFYEQFFLKQHFQAVGFQNIQFAPIEGGQRLKLEAYK